MSIRKELREAKSEITELRRLLARTFPSGDRRQPHALWKQVRRLSELAQSLEELSDPTPARPVGISNTVNVDQDESAGSARGGRSAHQPLFPGVRLLDRPGEAGKTLYHAGRHFDIELQRLTARLEGIIDDSASWIRGVEVHTVRLPSQQRSSCDACGELMAIAWRYCPYCAQPRPGDVG